MAQNDYFVIAARILAYLYDCLKKGEDPNKTEMSMETLRINQKYWEYIFRNLYTGGYITGISLVPIRGQIEDAVKLNEPMITPEGIEYLMENTGIKKALRYLASIGEHVPGLGDLLNFIF